MLSAPLEALETLPLADLFATRSLLQALPALLKERFAERRELEPFLDAIERGLPPEGLVELLPLVPGATVPPWQHLAAGPVVMVEPEAVRQEAAALVARASEDRERRGEGLLPEVEEALIPPQALEAYLAAAPVLSVREVDSGGESLHIATRPAPSYAGDVSRLAADLRDATSTAVVFLGNQGRADRLGDVLREEGLAVGEGTRILTRVGALSRGFEVPEAGLVVLADGDVFPEEVHLHARGRRRGLRTFLSDFRDLKVGDLVVHEEHGIGRFLGLETLEIGGATRELMVLGYQGGDKLKVPVEAFDRIQKYTSSEAARPAGRPARRRPAGRRPRRASRRRCATWRSSCSSSTPSARPAPATPSAGDSPWQREFEAAFEFDETPDQAARDRGGGERHGGAAADGPPGVRRRGLRQDRGGDARRVQARCSTASRWRCWRPPPCSRSSTGRRSASASRRSRCTVEMISRFRSPKEIKAVLAARGGSAIDVLIGTHRILSKDVVFRDLGLLVVDEEQRFGVAPKEKLKQLQDQRRRA